MSAERPTGSVAAGATGVSTAPGGAWLSWAAPWTSTLALVVVAVAFKLVYLAAFCPYTLVEDEAHYWEWSRRLEWSYYTKGPGVATTIALSTALGRTLGFDLTEFWIRLPAALASGVLMLAVAALARLVTRDGRVAFLAALLVLLAPGFHLVSLLMTIDGPYAACWAIAALMAYLALRRASGWAWIGLGLALGLGFTYKYTVLLLPPGIIAWAIANRRELVVHRAWRGLALGGLAAFAIGLLPVAIWNAQNDWGTVRHLLGHLGLSGGDMAVKQHVGAGWRYSPEWTIVLIVTQVGLMGPALFLAIGLAARRWRTGDPTLARPDLAFLIACSVPMFLFYLGVSFLAEPEGNWPLAGHITLFPLAALGVVRAVEHLRDRRAAWAALDPDRRNHAGVLQKRPQTVANSIWIAAVVVGAGCVLGSLRLDLLATGPVFSWIARQTSARGWTEPGRPIIPLGRVMYSDVMALDADRIARELAASTKQDPLVIAQQYGRASLLAFYMPGRPTVYCSSNKSEGRRTQYDVWPETSLDAPALRGRPAVLVGGRIDQWVPAFDRVEEIGALKGETKKGRVTFLGFGFRGFPAPVAHTTGAAR